MNLYQETNHPVVLVGSLKEMPVMLHHASSGHLMVIFLESKTSPLDHNGCYRVQISFTDATRILKFGYPGVCLSVSGNFSENSHDHVDIIADQVEFVHMPKNAEFDFPPHTTEKIFGKRMLN